jgi:adenylate cyclase
MGSGFDRKLALLASFSALACAASIGSLAYWAAGESLREQLRAEAQSAASQTALEISDELKGVMERSRLYVTTQQPRAFEADGELLGLSLLSQPETPSSESDEWEVRSRWALPAGNPSHLSDADFATLNLKYPIDYDRIAQGQSDVIFASAPGQPAFVRVGFPLGEKSPQGFRQAIVAEVRAGRIQAFFGHRDGLLTFLAAPRGQLIVASEAGHFGSAENLSQLGIVKAAHQARGPLGRLDYRETPSGDLQYAAFARPGTVPGLTVVAQSPNARVSAALEPLLRALAAAGGAFALLAGFAVWLLSSRWSWERGARAPGATAPAKDEATDAEATPPAAAPFVKIADPEVRKRLEQGKIKTTGHRTEAAVLHTHLHGVDGLSSRADPERLLGWLNEFNRKAVEAVESRHGIVDHLHGGSVVALWGVPDAHDDDVVRAIEAAAAISEAAHELNQQIRRQGLASCRLGMGLHHGPVAVGQLGAGSRVEYSAVGEALEVASRIQQFTDQFGTDFLMTGAAARKAGDAYPTEQVTAGDDGTPELFELAEHDDEAESAA